MVKNGNFKDIKVGTLEPTSVLNNLKGYFITSGTSDKVSKNESTNTVNGTIIGAPVYGSNSTSFRFQNVLDTNFVWTTEMTIAIIAKMDATTSILSTSLSNNDDYTNEGYFIFAKSSTGELIIEARVNGLPRSARVEHDKNGGFELVVARLSQSGNFLKVDRPKTGEVGSTALNGTMIRSNPQTVKIGGDDEFNRAYHTGSSEIALAAIWDRAITDEELATFYEEAKDFATSVGISTL